MTRPAWRRPFLQSWEYDDLPYWVRFIIGGSILFNVAGFVVGFGLAWWVK